jgi:colanic acid biosynthesis glycosyl transferase WcaI
MRILFINQYFPPDVSASAYLLGELAEDLARHHEVSVLVGRPSYNPEAGTYQPQGVAVHHVRSTAFARSGLLSRAINYLSFLVTSAAAGLRLPRADVVVTLTDPPVIGVVGILVAARFRCPHVYICQDIHPDVAVAVGRADNPLLVWAWRRLNKVVRGRATKIVAIGRDMVEKLEREAVDPSKITFIPNWADENPAREEDVKAVRAQLGWTDCFVVMHAGNVGLAQRLDAIIDTAERLQTEEDLRIVFLGDGAARDHLEHLVRTRMLRNVQFIDYLPKDQAQTLIAAADLHLISLAAGLWGCAVPSKVYGILAAGKPIVAAVQGRSEVALILTEAGCGERVEPGDGPALADAILRVRASGSAQLGEAGRTLFSRRYTRTTVTDQYRRLLEEVVADT